ncbi:uncharacterized protein K444DRAFT_704972 [Hyaloscypha bicolor E]|uniref:Uncharacterized protein n=1 Tax=Hyaloscypha bicolor E TaxID=1095630 RepID=A0A2J6SQW7_9HELO|nr:uncharacterized protein K444DRAFT_704972 [Hyaloscypha bicolor E]PMD53171.1 hypothetical protein K444DRAFT_704972 [Hyaloscypha bicolor E]
MASSARQYRQWINTIDYFWLIKDSDPSYLAKLLGLSVRDFSTSGSFRYRPKLRKQTLNVLLKIEKLSIRWTTFIENHLKLDIEKSTLWVLWVTSEDIYIPLYNFQERCLQRFSESTPELIQRNISLYKFQQEIAATWAILFTTGGNLRERATEYRRIKDPPWASPESLRFQKHYHLQHAAKIHKKFKIMTRERTPLRYAEFPILETRLRQLRHYMDSSQPRTLRQLWNDNRDTLSYYTFWGVIIFGGLSVFHAFFSLMIGIAQTVAAFKTLAVTTPPVPSP